jgi:peptide/nickel transport system substrate-binding protein
MKHPLKSLAVVGVAAALTAAGCSVSTKPSGEPESSSGSKTPSAESSVLRIKDKDVTAKGGTVYVLQDGDFDSLDPANNYDPIAQEVGRLIYRTLTFIKDTPGQEPSIQPDLAETLGTPSDDRRTWTYRLRPGLKYEDGRPITAQDIKYGVMRAFEKDVFTDGATWLPDLLANDMGGELGSWAEGFAGPYATPDEDLTSVETPDDRTLIFHFSGSQSDADWIMSLFYTAPVPKDSDTKHGYGNHPVASGPYKIEEYSRDKSLSLVRNENWDPASDPNRPAYPDRFQFALNVDAPAASERLLKGDGNDAFAVPSGGILRVSEFARAQEPSIGPRFINGPGSCVDYVTMNTQSLKDPDVRHAIALAIDRQGIAAIYGGEVFGSVADSVIPSDIPGYVAPDLGLSPAGDPDGAKTLLEGKSVPPLHMAVGNSDGAATKKTTALIEANLKAAGFDVVVDSYSDEDYSAVVTGVTGWDIDPSGRWCFDWPTAASMVLPMMGPNSVGSSWNSHNAAHFFDPRFSDQLQELTSSSDDSAAITKKVVDVANEIQTTAWPYLPLLHENNPEVVGANVTNVGISPIFGEVDLNTLAEKK